LLACSFSSLCVGVGSRVGCYGSRKHQPPLLGLQRNARLF
jgi:hypothetical protein